MPDDEAIMALIAKADAREVRIGVWFVSRDELRDLLPAVLIDGAPSDERETLAECWRALDNLVRWHDEPDAPLHAYYAEHVWDVARRALEADRAALLAAPPPGPTQQGERRMSEQAAQQVRCDDHHWVSTHQPDFPVYWIRQCSICGLYDADSMREEIAAAAPSESSASKSGPGNLDVGADVPSPVGASPTYGGYCEKDGRGHAWSQGFCEGCGAESALHARERQALAAESSASREDGAGGWEGIQAAAERRAARESSASPEPRCGHDGCEVDQDGRRWHYYTAPDGKEDRVSCPWRSERTRLIREQQRNGGGEITAIMVSRDTAPPSAPGGSSPEPPAHGV